MEIKPLISKTPQYPSLEEFIAHSNLLGKSIPKKWLNNKIAAGALTAFLLSGNSLAGDKNSNNERVEYVFDSKTADKTTEKKNSEQQQKKEVKVAPIFVHGDGHGVTGCMVMNAPVFLSEEEARKVIKEKFQNEGIDIDFKNTPTINFQADALASQCYFGEADSIKIPYANVNWELDGYSPNLNFVIEYVSNADYFRFVTDSGCGYSVDNIRTLRAADILNKVIRIKNKFNCVVFYDPVIDDEDDYEDSVKEAKKALIKQVEDFIEWAKDNGVIK